MAGWWDRVMVPRLIGCCCSQPPIMERRAVIVPRARGRVLELGAGGGINLPLYDRRRVSQVVGVDPSAGLRERAVAAMAPADRDFYWIEDGVAEDLPFPDASFDTVLSTFTLCSVQDQAMALAEARRVLKSDGELLFLEHGLSPDDSTHRWQYRLEPIWKRLAGGCHLTRPVGAAVERAGFAIFDAGRGYMEKTPRFAGWLEWGSARA